MILGIDPGLSGALALYSDVALVIFDMPTIETVVNKKVKRAIDAYQLGNWIDLHRTEISLAIVEQVGSMPEQGITSAFNFGFSTGVIHGVLAGNQVPMRTVTPAVWKRQFGLIGKGKDASRLAASRIVPQYADRWPLKKHDGRAEAFLLAAWGALQMVPQNFGGTD